MDQTLKESEPFLQCAWNVLVRPAVQMRTLPEQLVRAKCENIQSDVSNVYSV